MKRRSAQEREEAEAHERAEARREALLAELKAREAAARPEVAAAPPDTQPEETPEAVPESAAEPTEPTEPE